MIKHRKHDARGLTQTSWLTSYHSFSFAEYFSKDWHHFKYLRVINQDIIAPHQGFGMHSHADMEIITFMLQGTLTHYDSLGHTQKLSAGEIQLMRAGSGITHSEMNEANQVAELLQIWIYPATENLTPSYQQMQIPQQGQNTWQTIISPDQENTLHIQQKAELTTGKFVQARTETLKLNSNDAYWLQIITGELTANKLKCQAGDGLAITEETELTLDFTTATELLLFHFWQ